MTDKFWYKVARTIAKSGVFPVPINDALIELLQNLLTYEQAKFLKVFRKPSMTLEQINQRTDMEEEELLNMLNTLMYNGIIIGANSRSSGVMVYRLMGLYPGIFEYTFLRGTTTERDKKLAVLFEGLFQEVSDGTQKNYDYISDIFKGLPPTDRTLPVEKEVEVGTESVIPYEDVKNYIKNYEDIAVAHCYCRHSKDLIDDPCKLNAPKNNCFLLDKSAKFAIEQNFGRKVSKDEAIRILKEAEDFGLVHKVFHVHSDLDRGIEAICNCCKCCCGILNFYFRGILPLHTISSYLAKVDEELCVGCGTCVNICPMDTIDIDNTIAVVHEEKCIGCGLCAHHCPEDSIHLKRTGPRDVFLLPKKMKIE